MRFILDKNFDIVFQPFDIEYFAQFDLYLLILSLDEDRLDLCRRRLHMLVPLQRLVGRLEEIRVTDRFQQIVEGVHLVAVEGILFESRRKDDAGICLQYPRKFHAAQLRHLDIEEKQLYRLGAQYGQCLKGAVELCCEAEERSLVHITFQQTDGQWFIIDDCTC